MKKIISLLLVVVALATMLTACGKFECEACGEEKSGKKHKVEVLDEEATICDECYEELQELKDSLK